MAYQALARKYRPNKLSEVIGQDHVVKALANALATERLHHAYLLAGTRGVGKTTLARILAKCLNCFEGISPEPCDKCESCVGLRDESFLDFLEVDAASKTGVDDTRAMLEDVQYLPRKGRFKVYLIDEVHMLSASSFNVLLKTLEEPPAHVKFILATTNPKRVLPTVLSRCLQFQLRNISPEEISGQLATILEREKITFDSETLESIGRASQGSMRDALSITDQAIARCGAHLDIASVVDMLGTARMDEVALLLSRLAAKDREGLFKVTQDLAERSIDFSEVMDGLATSMHDLALSESTKKPLDGPLNELLGTFDRAWLQTAYQILIMGGRDLQYAPSPQVGFQMTLIRLLDFLPISEVIEPARSTTPRTDYPRTEATRQSPPSQPIAQKNRAITTSGSQHSSSQDRQTAKTTEAESRPDVKKSEQPEIVKQILSVSGGKVISVEPISTE